MRRIRAGVLNAAAGVDERTLVPNYQFHLGVPGASAGIQTAERLGLNAAIIAAARERLGSQQADIARFLDKLHDELAQLEVERKAAREQQYALNQERKRAGTRGRRGGAQSRARAGSKAGFADEGVRVSDARERAGHRGSRGATEIIERSGAAHRRGCGASFRRALIRPWSRIAPGRTRATRMRSRMCCGTSRRAISVLIKSMGKIGEVQREVEKDLFEVALGPIKMRVQAAMSAPRPSGSWIRACEGRPVGGGAPAEGRARLRDQRQHRRHAHGDQPDRAHGG